MKRLSRCLAKGPERVIEVRDGIELLLEELVVVRRCGNIAMRERKEGFNE